MADKMMRNSVRGDDGYPKPMKGGNDGISEFSNVRDYDVVGDVLEPKQTGYNGALMIFGNAVDWVKEHYSNISSVAFAKNGDIFAVSSYDFKLYRLSANGVKLWEKDISESFSNSSGEHLCGQMIVDEFDNVYVATGVGNSVNKYNDKGSLEWRYRRSTSRYNLYSIFLQDGYIYAGDYGAGIIKINADNGDEEKIISLRNSSQLSTNPERIMYLSLDKENYVYASLYDGGIIKYDTNNEELMWQTDEVEVSRPERAGALVVSGDYLYFCTRGVVLYKVKISDGTRVKREPLGFTSTVVDLKTDNAGNIIGLSESGHFFKYTKNLEEVWNTDAFVRNGASGSLGFDKDSERIVIANESVKKIQNELQFKGFRVADND